jgi:hypothetical protein
MSGPEEDPPVLRSHRRDAHVRTVSRASRAVAALAVLGTATFGGLAAARTHSTAASTTAGAASTSSPSRSDGLAAPASVPVPSAQAPVASSGGS